MLRHRRVAVAFNDMYGDAECREFLRIHVAAGAGAQEDDMLQVGAGAHRLGRHLRMVVEAEIVAGKQRGQIVRPDLALLVHRHRRVTRAGDVMEDAGEIVHGIEKQALHCTPS